MDLVLFSNHWKICIRCLRLASLVESVACAASPVNRSKFMLLKLSSVSLNLSHRGGCGKAWSCTSLFALLKLNGCCTFVSRLFNMEAGFLRGFQVNRHKCWVIALGISIGCWGYLARKEQAYSMLITTMVASWCVYRFIQYIVMRNALINSIAIILCKPRTFAGSGAGWNSWDGLLLESSRTSLWASLL